MTSSSCLQRLRSPEPNALAASIKCMVNEAKIFLAHVPTFCLRLMKVYYVQPCKRLFIEVRFIFDSLLCLTVRFCATCFDRARVVAEID